MRGGRAWSCSPCAVLLVSGFFGRDVAVSASHAGRQHQVNRDAIHRIAKAQVTAMAVLKRQEGGGGGVCPSEHSLCPESLRGGCCPTRYGCDVDSCTATTSGPSSACGKIGYYPCSNLGCCPTGYICGKGDHCYPPASATLSATSCPNNFFLCPESLSFGCCRSGMGCAVNACYSTNPTTATVTRIETLTSGSRVITTTTTATVVNTPTPPTGVPTHNAPDGEAKFIPTSVPKVPAQNASNDSGSKSGLSGAAIGGIVAGVVILLIAVVLAAFFIIRKLNKVVVDLTESKKSASDKHTATKKSASQIQQMEVYGRQLHSPAPYADDFGNDPLYITNQSTPQPDGAAADAGRNRSDSNPGGFTPSPNMFHDPRSRHASPDSNAGYFDHPGSALMQHSNMNQPPMQPARVRSSTESNNREMGYRYTHWRQQSNASELSADGSDNGHHAGVNLPLVIPELDASGAFVELPSEGQGGTRSRSGSASSRPHNRQRSDTQLTRSDMGLSPLDEEVEIHGYYGRRNQQAGQTAAGLGEMDYDVSSPVIPGYVPQQHSPPPPPQGGYYSPYTPSPPPKS